MAVVTALEYRGALVRIYLDGRPCCLVDKQTFAICPLSLEQEIHEDAYMKQLAKIQRKIAYEQALCLLDVCDRTEKQIMDRLMRRGIVPDAARYAVQRLKEQHLVDDTAYARRMVEVALDQRVGRYALRHKLLQKGITAEAADAAMEGLDAAAQQQACREVAEKLARRYQGEQDFRTAHRKLGQALMRRGFAWEQITPVLEEVLGNQDEEYEQ